MGAGTGGMRIPQRARSPAQSPPPAGLQVQDVVEPTWPERNDQSWGGWSPTRGRVIPGTAIYVAKKAGTA